MPVNSADSARVLVATAMVMLTTPGVALFYGGMVRRKNFVIPVDGAVRIRTGDRGTNAV